MVKKPALGDQVKDKITGFKGLVTGVTEYITGCRQFLVQPALKKGDFVAAMWLDEDRLTVIKAGAISLKVERDGCDIAAPVK